MPDTSTSVAWMSSCRFLAGFCFRKAATRRMTKLCARVGGTISRRGSSSASAHSAPSIRASVSNNGSSWSFSRRAAAVGSIRPESLRKRLRPTRCSSEDSARLTEDCDTPRRRAAPMVVPVVTRARNASISRSRCRCSAMSIDVPVVRKVGLRSELSYAKMHQLLYWQCIFCKLTSFSACGKKSGKGHRAFRGSYIVMRKLTAAAAVTVSALALFDRRSLRRKTDHRSGFRADVDGSAFPQSWSQQCHVGPSVRPADCPGRKAAPVTGPCRFLGADRRPDLGIQAARRR